MSLIFLESPTVSRIRQQFQIPGRFRKWGWSFIRWYRVGKYRFYRRYRRWWSLCLNYVLIMDVGHVSWEITSALRNFPHMVPFSWNAPATLRLLGLWPDNLFNGKLISRGARDKGRSSFSPLLLLASSRNPYHLESMTQFSSSYHISKVELWCLIKQALPYQRSERSTPQLPFDLTDARTSPWYATPRVEGLIRVGVEMVQVVSIARHLSSKNRVPV